jgi:hypothetical protein
MLRISGAVPLLPLYAFIAWKETVFSVPEFEFILEVLYKKENNIKI